MILLHRKRHGCRTGIISAIGHHTITITFEGKLYPTDKGCVRPYFEDLSVPHALKGDQLIQYRPYYNPTVMPISRAPLSNILNPIFISTQIAKRSRLSFLLKFPKGALHWLYPLWIHVSSTPTQYFWISQRSTRIPLNFTLTTRNPLIKANANRSYFY